MKRYGRSLAALMGLIAYMAVGFAGLRSQSEFAASALFTGTVTLLLAATVRAFLRPGAAWTAFVVFSWGYILMAFASYPAPPPLTNYLIGEAKVLAEGTSSAYVLSSPLPLFNRNFATRSFLTGKTYTVPDSGPPFWQIAHLLICPAFGLAGGIAARLVASKETEGSP